jgi:apyrase
MHYTKLILLTIFLSITNIASADQNHYSIIVDAGSSGSRLHLFEYHHDENNQLIVKDIFIKKTNSGLSSYSNHPGEAALSLKSLFDAADTKVRSLAISPKEVSVDILATAGMRLLPEKSQQDIYTHVQDYLDSHYSFSIKNVKTISGKMEGIYAWLELNYLEGNFAPGKETLGIIDMGGASTQIAFATQDTSRIDDEATVNINQQKYIIFSKSFLGLGLNQAIAAMREDEKFSACYPSGYISLATSETQYDFQKCSSIFKKVIAKHSIAEQLIPFDKTDFAVFSGVYDTFNFFGVEDASQGALEARMKYICTMQWNDMQKEYQDSQVADDILSTYCAKGIYLSNLLYNSYHLSYSQMWVTSKAHDHHELEWTMGVLLI